MFFLFLLIFCLLLGVVAGPWSKVSSACWPYALVMIPAALALDVRVVHLPLSTFLVAVCLAPEAHARLRSGVRATVVGVVFAGMVAGTYALVSALEFARQELKLCNVVADAVRAYAKQKGRRPENLEAIVPDFLPALPKIRSPIVGGMSYSPKDGGRWCVMVGRFEGWFRIECDKVTAPPVEPAPSERRRTSTGGAP